jgi:catechol 2,3-dioxygenase-like lactoylglutathione lyase family enzyme
MDLGVFSISLAVKDIEASLEFYGHLGFEAVDGGHMRQEMPDTETTKWRILENGAAHIGLFQGMFDDTILTFNPGDVRSIQKSLKDAEVELIMEADESTQGPAHIVLADPDGNSILIDQH